MGLGASRPDKVNARVSNFVNPKVTKCVTYITVPFQLYQESNGSVGFAPAPNMKREGQKTNPFIKIYESLDRTKDEGVVIHKISVDHIFNQTDVRVDFLVKDMFDFKPEVSGNEVVVEDPSSSGNDQIKEEMRVVYGGDRTIEENTVEKDGGSFSVNVPPSFDDAVKKEHRVLYRSTLVPSIIEKFAGQHDHLLDVIVNDGEEIILLPEQHPLMLFILACKDILKVQTEEIVLRKSERDEYDKMYEVASRVIMSAKRYLRATVFAKMFYTTFKDTDVHVSVTKDNDEILKSKWFKACGSDVAFRPTISFRFKVKYFKVDTKKPKSKLYAELTHYL